MEYFVVKDLNTDLYFRGKGVNKWGKYFNQASIYRFRKNAEDSANWENRCRGANCEVIQIQITETDKEVRIVTHGKWTKQYASGTTISQGYVASCCDMWHERKTDFCPYCGSIMDDQVSKES